MSRKFGLHESAVQVSTKYNRRVVSFVIRIDYVLTNNLTDSEIGVKIPFPSYTLKLLESQTPSFINEISVETHVFDEAAGRYDVAERSPDILCISALTPGIPRAYALAESAKGKRSLNSNRIIKVIGGIHATCLPWEALKHFDIVVRGEVTADFLSFMFGEALDLGVAVTPDKKVFRLSRMPDILDSPVIHWSKEELRNSYAIPFQGSTGCAGNCNFCSVTSVHGAKPRYVSEDAFCQALDEIHGNKVIALFDDNVLQFPTDECIDRLMNRASALRERGKRWAAEVTMKTLKQAQEKMMTERGVDLLSYLALCGLIGLYFGIESVDESLGLKKTIANKEAVDLIHYCRSLGISVLGAFVLGISPDETPDYVNRVLDFAINQANLDMIQASINTPLPGSANFISAVRDGTLRHTGWGDYDGAHCVFKHARMLPDELEYAHYRLLSGFYSAKSIVKRGLWLPLQNPSACRFGSHLWTLPVNAVLWRSSKRWPRVRVEESKRRRVHDLEPEVLAQVERALEENPTRPSLFQHNKPNDGISVLF